MLVQLQIENVAIIEKLIISMSKGFNVLTGETGAGKSILIDSLGALLGSRISRELIRSGRTRPLWRAYSFMKTMKLTHFWNPTG